MINSQYDRRFMKEAIRLASKAYELGEVPIGAVVVLDNQIIGQGYNQKEHKKNCLKHAEIIAIDQAQKTIGDWRLQGASLYSTCEPCIMCSGAIVAARIRNVFFGISNPKFGGVISLTNILDLQQMNHSVDYKYGFYRHCITRLMRQFFINIR